jgi:hypothetical protein
MTTEKYHRHRRTRPTTQNTAKVWYKSPAILSTITLSIAGIVVFLVIDILTPRVININAFDHSDSIEKFKEIRKEACQAAVHNYRSGDRLVQLAFADRTAYLGNTEIGNTLELLGKCLTQRAINDNRPGTDFAALLTFTANTVQQERKKGNNQPIVFNVVIQAAEPVAGATPFDSKVARQQVEIILDKGGFVTLMVEDIDLRTELHNVLDDNPRVKVSDFSHVSAIIDNSFAVGRKR